MDKTEWQLRWCENACRVGKKVVLLRADSKTEFKLEDDGSITTTTTPIKDNRLQSTPVWHDEVSRFERAFIETGTFKGTDWHHLGSTLC